MLASLLFTAVVIGAAEIIVRTTANAPFLGVSKKLFAKDPTRPICQSMATS